MLFILAILLSYSHVGKINVGILNKSSKEWPRLSSDIVNNPMNMSTETKPDDTVSKSLPNSNAGMLCSVTLHYYSN